MHIAYKWFPQTESAHLLARQTYPTKRPRATVGFVSELPAKSASILPACEECRLLKGTESACSELVHAGLAGMPWRRGAEWTGSRLVDCPRKSNKKRCWKNKAAQHNRAIPTNDSPAPEGEDGNAGQAESARGKLFILVDGVPGWNARGVETVCRRKSPRGFRVDSERIGEKADKPPEHPTCAL
jgi:hypothetical protein